ncbi:tetratricopeptide (TPR) repeat protein [Enterococcus sp. PF1-24]|uniref:tetratricopeptide repeat protein n=1 Tax=unclassified Enterococcus TaxID=2608891 RepID=UPI0024768C7C|nr:MULTISPECIES: hypothetical protein [unclassified Enterococcus]MDH6365014.1 tetratricopeptide (TPR) repeat protein [Enterococcus sp. PFB1-1]MDH6402115.1 tetratricopeptide (TPR) repeat protein [Enterococcus sp. PF1-24]
MKKIQNLANDINDVPVIFIRANNTDRIVEKISINELKRRNTNEEDHRIKMYRAALDHYANKNYELAEILLIQLIQSSDTIYYEYYERLASLYKLQRQVDNAIEVLEEALDLLKETHAPENLLCRVEHRLNKYRMNLEKGNENLVNPPLNS